MAVTVTTINPQDSIASSRLTLNSNFTALKSGINAVQSLLDPTTYILSGVKSATIDNSAVAISTVIFTVTKGSLLYGNVTMGTTGASSSVLINGTGGFTIDSSNLTLTNGNLSLSSTSSLLTVGGDLTVAKEFRLQGSSTAFSAIYGLTAASTAMSPTDLKYIVVRNDSTTVGLTATLSAGNPGQVIEIYHIRGASGYQVNLSAANFYGLTGSISMRKTGDTLKVMYDSPYWYLWSYSAASFAGTTGATSSSITFTTT